MEDKINEHRNMNIVTWNGIFAASVRANGPLQLILYLSNLDFGRFIEYSKAMEFLENDSGDFILDVGAGYSTFPPFIQKQLKNPCEYVTLDLSLAACKYQAESHLPHRHQIRCDMTHLPIKSDSIRTIVAISSVEHVPDSKMVFGEMGRVLRGTGIAILSLPHSPKGTPTIVLKHSDRILFLLRKYYGFWRLLLSKHINYFIEQTTTDSILKYFDPNSLTELTQSSGMEIEQSYYFGNSSSHFFQYVPRGWFIVKDVVFGFILAKTDESQGGTPANSRAIVFKARKRG